MAEQAMMLCKSQDQMNRMGALLRSQNGRNAAEALLKYAGQHPEEALEILKIDEPGQIKTVLALLKDAKIAPHVRTTLSMLSSEDGFDILAASQLFKHFERHGVDNPAGVKLLQMLSDANKRADAVTILRLDSREINCFFEEFDGPTKERVIDMIRNGDSRSVSYLIDMLYSTDGKVREKGNQLLKMLKHDERYQTAIKILRQLELPERLQRRQ